jgi:CheY-like chemotaxis protein
VANEDKFILIVEDSQDIRILIKKLLEQQGYFVIEATNGKQALELLQNTNRLPHLIIFDLMMPDINGYEFRKQQRGDPKIANIPVLVISADSRIPAAELGIDPKAAIKKPFDIGQFLDVVESLIGR